MSGSDATGPGVVYLVGAGPGDPGLVTVRALELVRRADVLAYDRLIPAGLTDLAPEGCERVYVGKRPGAVAAAPEARARAQGDINELLVRRAKEGKVVVRLKGGDPFVFGRGAEEAEACVAAGVRVEVVPGVTSAVAAAAYAGIPMTHRDLSPAFAVVTGHEDPRKPDSTTDWHALARIQTLCVLMPVGRLELIADRLRQAGRSPDTPAALVEQATLPTQRVVRATLGTIAGAAAAAGTRPPAVLVIGEVAALADRIAWAERRSLAGVSVLVPRARGQAGPLSELLRERGADPVELPTITIEPPTDPGPLADAAARLARGDFTWTALTSTNGVNALRGELEAAGHDARVLARTRVAAVGPGTAAALRDWGITPDLVPARGTTEVLGREFPLPPAGGGAVLLPRSDLANPVLPVALRAKGWEPVDVVAYRTVPVRDLDPELRERLDGGTARRPRAASADGGRSPGVDWVAFTAPSTVEGFLRAYGSAPPPGTRVAAIGPVTARAARAAGLRVDAEATEHTIHGLVAAIEDAHRDSFRAAPTTPRAGVSPGRGGSG